MAAPVVARLARLFALVEDPAPFLRLLGERLTEPRAGAGPRIAPAVSLVPSGGGRMVLEVVGAQRDALPVVVGALEEYLR